MGPKNRHIGGVFPFFDTLGTKNTVDTDVFCASENKTTVFTMFSRRDIHDENGQQHTADIMIFPFLFRGYFVDGVRIF